MGRNDPHQPLSTIDMALLSQGHARIKPAPTLTGSALDREDWAAVLGERPAPPDHQPGQAPLRRIIANWLGHHTQRWIHS